MGERFHILIHAARARRASCAHAQHANCSDATAGLGLDAQRHAPRLPRPGLDGRDTSRAATARARLHTAAATTAVRPRRR
eukprot:SAG31_NODE_17004_length_687_cov_0.698980_1_plen_79_part_10